MAPVVLGLVLLLLFASVAVAFAWQEARAEIGGPVEFVVRDATAHVWDRLDDEARALLSRADVERMILWETQFQQEIFIGKHGDEASPVIAGYDGAVYVQTRGLEAGFPYDGPLIEKVLALEADYLASIGGVADVVEEDA
jgi:hypothetical protein